MAGIPVQGVCQEAEAVADRGNRKTAGDIDRKRIIDAIPYGSRLASVVAHLTVEEITTENGWKMVIQCIEDAHDYLKVQKLEQAFSEAIFRGRCRHGQILSGFWHRRRRASLSFGSKGLDLWLHQPENTSWGTWCSVKAGSPPTSSRGSEC